MNTLSTWHSACRYAAGTMRALMVALFTVSSFGVEATTLRQAPVPGQGQGRRDPVATFKSSIDLVRINAIVRDKKGRFVSNLSATTSRSKTVACRERSRNFARKKPASASPCCSTSAAAWKTRMKNAREAATHLLSWLKEDGDEAAVFTFDTRLVEVSPFRSGHATSARGAVTHQAVRRDVVARCDRAHSSESGVTRGAAARCRRASPTGKTTPVSSRPAKCPGSPARSTCRSTSSASCRRSTTRRRNVARTAPSIRRWPVR